MYSMTMSQENENKILTYCRTPQTANPLYVVVLASDLAHISTSETGRSSSKTDEKIEARINLLLQQDTVELYKTLLVDGRKDFERCDEAESEIVLALLLIYASRNGVSESELFELIPTLSWNLWAPVIDALKSRHILTLRSGKKSRFEIQLKHNSGCSISKNSASVFFRGYLNSASVDSILPRNFVEHPFILPR